MPEAKEEWSGPSWAPAGSCQPSTGAPRATSRANTGVPSAAKQACGLDVGSVSVDVNGVSAGDVAHVQHGTWAAYTTDKCRCPECRSFKSAYIKDYRARQRSA
jgi:hypothetical protein